MKVVSTKLKKSLPVIDSRPNSRTIIEAEAEHLAIGNVLSHLPLKDQLGRLSRRAEQPGGMQAMLRHARNTMAHPVKHLNGRVSIGDREYGSRTQKGTALGSSQRDECIGDFCSYDVSVNFTEMDSQENPIQ